MSKAVNIGIWSLLIVGVFALLGFVENDLDKTPWKDVSVSVDRSNGNYFIDNEEIEEWIARQYYRDSTHMVDLDLMDLEKRLNEDPSISNAEVFTTINGKLKVEITQRQPIIRVFDATGKSYYIDQEGMLMPLSNKYTSRVLVANGNINATFDSYYKMNVANWEAGYDTIPEMRKLHNLFLLASKINGHDFWRAQFNQVFVGADEEIELIPRVGNHRIIIGDVEALDTKLEKLMVFYKKGLNRTGWNEYSEINLKFKNQIVCTKR